IHHANPTTLQEFWEAGERAFQAERRIMLQSGKINFGKLANIKVTKNPFCTLKKEEPTLVSHDNNINTPTTVAPSHLARKARDTPLKSKKKSCNGTQHGEQKMISHDTKVAKRHTLVASLANARNGTQHGLENKPPATSKSYALATNAQDGIQCSEQNKFKLRLDKKSNRSTKEKKKKASKNTKINKKILKEYLYAIKKDDIKDPKIEKKFEQLRTKLYQIQHHYNYTSALDDDQLEEILKMKEKVTGVTYRKAHESQREYIFDFLNKISNKNDVSIFALRGAINDMLKEYERDTNLAITITRANNAQNEKARKAIQNKYRDLLATQLKTKGQMIIEENIEMQLSKNQSQIKTKPPPPRLELPKTGYREEHQYPGSPRSPPKSPTESDKSSIDSNASKRKKRWMLSITERLRPLSPTGEWKQVFGGSESSKQHTHSPKQPSSLRNSVDFTNTPDIVLPTSIQNNQQIRNPK
ncbi:2131_t:CDS:2, partial [Dentiscutata heterogama]